MQKMSLHPGWLLFAGLALALPTGALLMRNQMRRELPVLAELPPFSLVDEEGRPFGKADMAGRVWIADFVFTSCADACPRLQGKMKKIQDRLIPREQGGEIALLSISVDPERDTPQKLKQYGEVFGARRGLWKSLTGQQQEVEKTVVKGFHTAMAKMPRPGDASDATAFDIMHGERLVLVDRQGRLRGFYEADDQDHLLRDARSLTAGGNG